MRVKSDTLSNRTLFTSFKIAACPEVGGTVGGEWEPTIDYYCSFSSTDSQEKSVTYEEAPSSSIRVVVQILEFT